MAKQVFSGIATGLTIAALFRTSFEAFDIFQTSRNQDLDYKKLKLRLNVEKCRLYIWGESMGLVDISPADQNSPDEGLQFPATVRHILEELFGLFQSAERLKDKYGYRETTVHDFPPSSRDKPSNFPNTSSADQVNTPQPSQATRIKQTITWVVYDHKKFAVLITEIRDLIGKLKDVTSQPVVTNSTNRTRSDIGPIKDTEALALIAHVCATDHPDVIRLRQRRPMLYSQSQQDSIELAYLSSRIPRYGNPRL